MAVEMTKEEIAAAEGITVEELEAWADWFAKRIDAGLEDQLKRGKD